MERDIRKKSLILIVDDDETLSLSLKIFLVKAGYPFVTTVATHEGAIELINKYKFDLIISDIVLGRSSGIDLLRQIRQKGVQCAVVMMTGYPSSKTKSEAESLGAFDYLHKPVKKEDILQVTHLALQQVRSTPALARP